METRWVLVLTLASFLWLQTNAENGEDLFDYNLGIGSSPLDLVILIDTSRMDSTLTSQNEQKAFKQFFIDFLESADIISGNVQVAMVTYSTHPEIVFQLNSFVRVKEVQEAIRQAIFKPGERNTADALDVIRRQVLTRGAGDRRDVPNVVLMLQTGMSDRHQARTVQEAEALKFTRTNIFGLGYQLGLVAAGEMDEVASRPTSENTFKVDTVEEFQIIKDIVFAQIFTRAEQAHKSPVGVSEKIDLVFLLHFSNQLSKAEFNDILKFSKNIVKYSNIDGDDIRVAAAMYRKKGDVVFDFNQRYTTSEVLRGLSDISYNYRSRFASLAEGLDTVREKILIEVSGDRPDVPDLVVIVTDDIANTDVGRTIEAAEKLRLTGTAIFGIGIGLNYPNELRAISTSEDYTIFVNNSRWLSGQELYLHDQFVGCK